MTRTARTLLLLATFGALLIAVVAGALAQMPPLPTSSASAATPPAVEVSEPQRIDAIPAADPADVDARFIAALFGSDSEYDAAHAQELVYAGHRVCEGHTDGVPADVMAATLADDHGWTADEAARFVALADEVYCGTPAV